MLLEFSTSNFRSIKTEACLSLLAGNGKEHAESLINNDKEKLLPMASIFGANAAGKSNVMHAMSAAIIAIRESNRRQIDNIMPYMIPFTFSKESSGKTSFFDFIFINNGRKFQYGFSADMRNIYDEYLYEYKSSWKSLIFNRTNINDYNFTKENSAELNQYIAKNNSNKLFLATATEWGSALTKDAFLWFAQKVDTYDKNYNTIPDALVKNEDSGLKNFISDMLIKADLSIKDFSIDAKDINQDISNILSSMPQGRIYTNNQSIKQIMINMTHSVKTKTESYDYTLPFELESGGTQKFFFIVPVIKDALERGRTVYFDDFNSELHPLMVRAIIELFANPEINRNGAQLIFNSLDASLLDLNLFRRDEIYFAEKNRDTLITELFSLDEFSARKTENVSKNYIAGRYGAIPEIDLGGLEW